MKLQTSPLRLKSFQEMNLVPSLLTALEKMKISKPTEVQCQAIPVGLEGQDLIAIAQTGSGKTLAFALSVLTTLEKKPEARALVLVPSREMAQQIEQVFAELCAAKPITTVLVVGGIKGDKQESRLNKKPRLIIATPGRMNDHLQTNKLLLQNVEMIVIDEADRMLDMGFAPQLKSIQSTLRGPRQIMMFSASFGGGTESIAALFMSGSPVMIRSERAEKPVEGLTQKVLFVGKLGKNDRLLDELNATKGGVIVFTANQERYEFVGKFLKEYGYETDYTHGGLSQGHRNRVLREFREGEIRIMVVTDLLARGLDVPHVDTVVNFDLPAQAEDFLHRIGRTARAGRTGVAITFVGPLDSKMYPQIKSYLLGAEEIKVDKNFAFLDRRQAEEESKELGERKFNLKRDNNKKYENRKPDVKKAPRRDAYKEVAKEAAEKKQDFKKPEFKKFDGKKPSFKKSPNFKKRG